MYAVGFPSEGWKRYPFLKFGIRRYFDLPNFKKDLANSPVTLR